MEAQKSTATGREAVSCVSGAGDLEVLKSPGCEEIVYFRWVDRSDVFHKDPGHLTFAGAHVWRRNIHIRSDQVSQSLDHSPG